jgi:hypothetical protein
MKYVILVFSILLSACSIRAVALIETEEAAIQGSTTIQRKQGESRVQSTTATSTLLDSLLTPNPRIEEETTTNE